MATVPTTDERLAKLESEVAQLKQFIHVERQPQNWLERVVGSMAEYPEFQEVVRLGREFRRSYRPDEDE